MVSAAQIAGGQTPPSAPVPAQARAHEVEAVARRVELRARVAGPSFMPSVRGGMMMDAASMFLAHTGELQLTDAQVTKLAAIARRSEARQRAMRARMDSAMTMRHTEHADGAPDGQAGAMKMVMMMRMPMPTDAERKAQHDDDREAFSVLTPDQLATAWETMMSHHGGGPMMPMPGR